MPSLIEGVETIPKEEVQLLLIRNWKCKDITVIINLEGDFYELIKKILKKIIILIQIKI